MKAVVMDGVGQYGVADLPEPVPGAGEVAIRVAYAGVQWGDVLVRDGHIPLARPFVPGFEAAGRIVAVGDGVAPGRVGEEVVALVEGGACAEVVVAPDVLALGVGDAPLRDAAALGWAGPTAYDLVAQVGRVREGDRVLVHAAAGGVGTLAGQVARAAGAASVVGVAGSRARAAYAEGFGYDRVVTRDAFPQVLAEDSFDVVLDPVGGATRTANLALLAPHGRLAVYGGLGGAEPVQVPADELLMRGVSVLTYNSALLARTHPDRLAASVRHVLGMLGARTLRVGVGAELPLDAVGAAVAGLATGTAAPGKTLLHVS